jgi:hypothetical protein
VHLPGKGQTISRAKTGLHRGRCTGLSADLPLRGGGNPACGSCNLDFHAGDLHSHGSSSRAVIVTSHRRGAEKARVTAEGLEVALLGAHVLWNHALSLLQSCCEEPPRKDPASRLLELPPTWRRVPRYLTWSSLARCLR